MLPFRSSGDGSSQLMIMADELMGLADVFNGAPVGTT